MNFSTISLGMMGQEPSPHRFASSGMSAIVANHVYVPGIPAIAICIRDGLVIHNSSQFT